MDTKVFWLVGFGLIGIVGGILILARRYKNPDKDAGYRIAIWIGVLLSLWFLGGTQLVK